MKIIAAVTAFAALGGLLGALLAGPAESQAATQSASAPVSAPAPILAPGFSGAFDDAKRKCHDLAAPYKGSMLEGKISVDDEDTSTAMMANETYPSVQEAVVLRGFIAAFEKCENVQLAFLKQYAAWDVPNAQYILDTQKPVYLALMARQITYGMANRNINNAQIEVAARRKAMWPKEMLDTKKLDADFRSALAAVTAKCDAMMAPLKSGILKGRIAFDEEETPTPAMLADKSMPSDREATELRKLAATTRQCLDLNKEFTRTYAPQYVPVVERKETLRMAVYLALTGQRMSYGEANRRLEDTKAEVAALLKTTAAEYQKQRAARAANAAAPQEAAPPQATPTGAAADANAARTAGDLMKTRCDALYAPLREGALKGKIAMDRNNATTPQMLMDHSRPNAAEIAALKTLVDARSQCQAYIRDYIRLTAPPLLPEMDRQNKEGGLILTGLIAGQLTYGEANQKAYELETQFKQAVEEVKAKQDQLRQEAAAAPTPVTAPATAQVPPIDVAYRDADQKCKTLLQPFRNGILRGKIPMLYHEPIAQMLNNDVLPTAAEAEAVIDYAAAQKVCATYQDAYTKTYRAWLQPALDRYNQRLAPVLAALGARKMRFAEAARKMQEIELAADAEMETATNARQAGAQPGFQGTPEMQRAFDQLQPESAH